MEFEHPIGIDNVTCYYAVLAAFWSTTEKGINWEEKEIHSQAKEFVLSAADYFQMKLKEISDVLIPDLC
jgi:hypothetical protein